MTIPAAYEDAGISQYLTIGGVSQSLEVPAHTLRHWEKHFSQIKPMRHAGGRRYYRKQDVELLRRVKELVTEHGYTLAGAQRRITEEERQARKRLKAGETSDLSPDLSAVLDEAQMTQLQDILVLLETTRATLVASPES